MVCPALFALQSSITIVRAQSCARITAGQICGKAVSNHFCGPNESIAVAAAHSVMILPVRLFTGPRTIAAVAREIDAARNGPSANRGMLKGGCGGDWAYKDSNMMT